MTKLKTKSSLKKKKKLSIYKFSDDIYKSALLFCVGDKKKFTDYFNKNYQTEFQEDGSRGKFFSIENDGKLMHVIFVSEIDTSLIYHEIIHYIFSLFNHRGVPITLDNDESFTYFADYIYNKIKKKLRLK